MQAWSLLRLRPRFGEILRAAPADCHRRNSSSAALNLLEDKGNLAALKPSQVVTKLDDYIIGQSDAKRAVAIALRNRWRRHHLPESFKNEVHFSFVHVHSFVPQHDAAALFPSLNALQRMCNIIGDSKKYPHDRAHRLWKN